MLVLDASVAVAGSLDVSAFGPVLEDDLLIAPPLMWSEARCGLRRAMWRREISPEMTELARAGLRRLPVERREPDDLDEETWSVAEEFGWAKTYDAEYVALARLMDCRLVTLDLRLRRGADRTGLVVTPTELNE